MTDSMRGRVCLITGATSGIGKATAHALAALGASVVLIGRDPQKGEATVQRIRENTGNEEVELLSADLTSQTSIRELADHVLAEHDQLHVLVNCAGAFFRDRRVTIDGLEMTFALNHLAYFLLTTLLLDLLHESAPARVVNVTSGAHSTGRIDFDDLQGERGYRGHVAYSQSKLANVLFSYELARRLHGTSVTANALHPGVVSTSFGVEDPASVQRVFIPFLRLFMKTPAQGAATPIHLACAPELEHVTGRYFANSKPTRSSKPSYDEAAATRLWQVSGDLVGLTTAADTPSRPPLAPKI